MPLPVVAWRSILVAAALAATSCAAGTGGYHRPAADAECRARGIDPHGEAFAACVKNVEDAEYRRWSRGAPGQ
jgi:hypothetical protein